MLFESKCPACGYSLQGEVIRWTEVCPLDGQCSECGRRFEWREVFDPARQMSNWCVEYCASSKFPFAAIRTSLYSLRPSSFWSDLRLAQPVRFGRLAAYVFFLVALSWLIYTSAGAFGTRGVTGHSVVHAMRWFCWPFVDVDLDFPGVKPQVPFNSITTPSTWHFARPSLNVGDSVWYVILAFAFWPIAYVCIWLVSKNATFTPRSIARTFAYSFVSIVLVALLAAGNTLWMAKVNFSTATPGDLSIYPSLAFAAFGFRIFGTTMPNGWHQLDLRLFPIVVCLISAWWWICSARAHDQKRIPEALFLVLNSAAVVFLWDMRFALLHVWLDVKAILP